MVVYCPKCGNDYDNEMVSPDACDVHLWYFCEGCQDSYHDDEYRHQLDEFGNVLFVCSRGHVTR